MSYLIQNQSFICLGKRVYKGTYLIQNHSYMSWQETMNCYSKKRKKKKQVSCEYNQQLYDCHRLMLPTKLKKNNLNSHVAFMQSKSILNGLTIIAHVT